jgi:hypothetical protein
MGVGFCPDAKEEKKANRQNTRGGGTLHHSSPLFRPGGIRPTRIV